MTSSRLRPGRRGRRSGGPHAEDLNWVFTVQTERVVAKDNTVTIGDRSWQLEKSRFRHCLAGSRVTIHEHLDGSISIRFGPHVVGRYAAGGEEQQTSENGNQERPWKSRARGNRGKPQGGFPPFPPSLGNPAKPGFPLSHRRDDETHSFETPEAAFGEQKGIIGCDQLMRTDPV